MAKVVYILSPGHSGSTLLDLLIGSIPGVFSTGECLYLPWMLHRKGLSDPQAANEDICSCLKGFHECEAWRKILLRLGEELGFDLYREPFRFPLALFRRQGCNRGSSLSDRMIRSLAVLSAGSSLLPGVDKIISMAKGRIIKNNWMLFDTIAAVKGVSHVVDSSKDPVRMHLLSLTRPADLIAVILVREMNGIAASAMKWHEDPLRSVRKWQGYYRNLHRLLSASGKRRILFVRYESVCRDPERARRKIARNLKLPDPVGDLQIDTRHYHLIAGNPIRYKGTLKIRKDESWREVLDKNTIRRLSVMAEKSKDILTSLQSKSACII